MNRDGEIMNKDMAMTDRQPLIEQCADTINETCDKLVRVTERICNLTDRLVGCQAENPSSCKEAPIDKPGTSGMLDSSVRRIVDRVECLENELSRFIDSNII